MSQYRCNHCGQVVERVSNKKWIRSFCSETGKTVRLWRVQHGR